MGERPLANLGDALARFVGKTNDVLTLQVELRLWYQESLQAVLASSPTATFFHVPWSGHHQDRGGPGACMHESSLSTTLKMFSLLYLRARMGQGLWQGKLQGDGSICSKRLHADNAGS